VSQSVDWITSSLFQFGLDVIPANSRLRARWLKRIQARVIALIGEDAPLVEVNLPEHKLELKASIKFEGASGAAETAAILDESIPLMDQINVAIDVSIG
jgi:hypothetical protein